MGWWTTDHALSGMTISQALGLTSPRSNGGAMNVLLIGLDSRRDQQGNELPQEILDQLHAGDSDTGGYNTNTLILAHLDADNKVTAFSIPRDDYVAADGIPGYDHIKIKEAYGLAKANAEQALVDQGVGDQEELERKGREAGRAATLRAVRDLTGQPIDYFAEVNLAGFYDLASALGSIQVCLNHAVYDDFSGADFPAGPQSLDASQALAFVRQRHGLDNGDLDRTHRQQAFLVSVLRQLQDGGAVTDMSKFNALVDVAKRDVVLSSGWGPAQFVRISAIAGSNVTFQTLPVLRYDSVDGQDVNIVDPAAIRAEVAAAFSGAAASSTPRPKPSSTVDVINAGDTSGLAGTVSQWLSEQGYAAGEVRNAEAGEPTSTAIGYGDGAGGDADALAKLLNVTGPVQADPALGAGHVRVVLGPSFTLPADIDSAPPSTVSAASVDGTAPTDAPNQGQPVDGHGIPCVD
ncbi:LCP family protein [Mycolicibacterium madagascariense]|nr:LCP family protein [Mycolicibacterium madagascariense]MCV7015283.1 LCP family protein [Mycolicibacterium madagascariense]